MREILFRGKQVSDGEWIEGYVFPQVIDGGYAPLCITTEPICANDYSEILGNWAIVDSSTVGQYTGLTDKNGRKIFEGDIIAAKHPDHARSVSGIVKYGEFKDVDSCDTYHYLGFYIEIWGHCISILEPMNEGIELEVIGNIHDNPELLEVKE